MIWQKLRLFILVVGGFVESCILSVGDNMNESTPKIFVITLTHPRQLEFLCSVFEFYCKSGVEPAHLPEAADTYVALMNAREIPVQQNVGEAVITDVSDHGITMEVNCDQ